MIRAFLRRELPFFVFMRWQCAPENGWAVTAAPSASRVRYTHESKYLGFADGYDRFLETLGSKLKNDLRKKTEKLQKLGTLGFSVHSDPHELPEAFARFLAVEDCGWKGKGGTSLRRQPKRQDYYRHLLDNYGRLGLCRINILSLDGSPIAAQFGIEVGRCLYLLKIGFQEEQVGQHSPGAVLLLKTVEHLCQQSQVKAVSFVTGSGWCDRWHPSAVRVGIFYTDCDSLLSRIVVRLIQWGLRWRDWRKARGVAGGAAGKPA
jgi:CelD/BcsL family acetyltransferase involved in cellulose biosynthesis